MVVVADNQSIRRVSFSEDQHKLPEESALEKKEAKGRHQKEELQPIEECRTRTKRTASDLNAVKAERTAFLSDEEIARSRVWRSLKAITYGLSRWFNDMDVVGIENLPPKGEGALLISMHTTHNADIFAAIGALQEVTGRVARGLFHRNVMQWHPWIRYLGGVPGQRKTAKLLLEEGHLVAVIPGGGEEAMRGHDSSYELYWQSSTGRKRMGFAELVLSLDRPTKIVPTYTKNAEEMRFNIFFWLWHLIGGYIIWEYAMELARKHNYKRVAAFIFMTGGVIWFCLSILGIPIPVKTTVIIGKPVLVDPTKDTPEEVVKRAHAALQGLIDANQPSRGKNYIQGLRERGLLKGSPEKQKEE